MNALHRATKRYLKSVSPTDLEFPLSEYIENPDMTPVEGFSNIYWIISGDSVSLMSSTERAAVDVLALEVENDNITDNLDTKSLLRAFALVMLSQINQLRADHGRSAISVAQLKTAIRSKL